MFFLYLLQIKMMNIMTPLRRLMVLATLTTRSQVFPQKPWLERISERGSKSQVTPRIKKSLTYSSCKFNVLFQFCHKILFKHIFKNYIYYKHDRKVQELKEMLVIIIVIIINIIIIIIIIFIIIIFNIS